MKRVKLTIEGYVDDKVFEVLMDRGWNKMPVTICGNMMSIAMTRSEVFFQSSGDMSWAHDGVFTAKIMTLASPDKVD